MVTTTARTIGTALLILAAVGACSPQTETGSSAGACAAPHLAVSPTAVAPGDRVTVTGTAMKDGCADTIEMDEDGNVVDQETETPFTGVDVTYRSGDTEPVVLATVDADEQGAFEVVVTIPADAPLGHAEIHAGPEWVEPAVLEVTPGT
jgi:hypothetical protein